MRACTNTENVWTKFGRLFIKSVESLVQEEFTRQEFTLLDILKKSFCHAMISLINLEVTWYFLRGKIIRQIKT